MIELDGDEERISSQGRYAERDIVQVRRISPETRRNRLGAQPSVPRNPNVGFMVNEEKVTAFDLLCSGWHHFPKPHPLFFPMSFFILFSSVPIPYLVF